MQCFVEVFLSTQEDTHQPTLMSNPSQRMKIFPGGGRCFTWWQVCGPHIGEKAGPVAPAPIGKACAVYQVASGSTSTERRFITLLDADTDQLPHRLRQLTALLKEQTIDFDALLQGLLFWNDDQKRTQNTWARDFYRSLTSGTETEATTEEKESK